MNNKMLEDYTVNLEKKYRKALIALWVLSILLVIFICLSIFLFFFDFSVDVEETEEYNYDIEQVAEDEGQNISIANSEIATNDKNHDSLYILVGVVICVIALVIGVVLLYGKTKNKNKSETHKKNNDS